ncbi:MAG: HNH/ENDO VII family nuclease [Microbacteriaceae bacterium]
MVWWAVRLEDAQSKADANLGKAKIARADLDAAQDAIARALSVQGSVDGVYAALERVYERYHDSGTSPPDGVTVPTEWQLRQARNAASSAAASVSDARGDARDAQDRLDVATRLVQEAKSDYEDDARTVVARIEAAKQAGVRVDSWWESVYHSEAWGVVVAIVTVVVVVAAVVLTGGVALAVIIAGSALLLADALMAYAEGDIGTGEFVLDVVLLLIPGGKLLGTAGKGAKLAIAAAKGTKGASKGVTVVEKIAGSSRTVRTAASPNKIRTLSKEEKKLYSRPKPRATTKREVWERAKDESGVVSDPVTEKVINPDESWDMGHRPGYEFRKLQASAAQRKLTRQEFLDEFNTPSHFRPELPSSNRSHVGEDKLGRWLGP